MNTKALDIIRQNFPNVTAVKGGAYFVVKQHYTPFLDEGEGYYIIDAYYLATNRLFHKMKETIEALKQNCIEAQRYRGLNYKGLAIESNAAMGQRRNNLAYDEKGSHFCIGVIEVVGSKGGQYPKSKVQAGSQEIVSSAEKINAKEKLLDCKSCTLCLKACPTGAISLEGFNPSICLRHYMNTGYPTKEDKEKAGRRILGCDICQRACPFNMASAPTKMPKELKGLLKIKGFSKRLSENQEAFIKYIGKNFISILHSAF